MKFRHFIALQRLRSAHDSRSRWNAALSAFLLEVQMTSAVSGEKLTLTRPLQVTGDARFCVNTHVMWFSLAHAGRDLDHLARSRHSAVGLLCPLRVDHSVAVGREPTRS